MQVGPISIEFSRKSKVEQVEKNKKPLSTFTSPEVDGGIDIIDYNVSPIRSVISLPPGLTATNQSDFERIRLYRSMSNSNEVSRAINDIIQEAVVMDEPHKVVELNLSETDLQENTKKKIQEAFDKILRVMKFKRRGQELFRRWYVDGRIYFEVVVDKQNLKDGIQNLNYIDSIKIQKVRQIIKKQDSQTGRETIEDINEYFLYTDLQSSGPNGASSIQSNRVSYGSQLQSTGSTGKNVLFKKDSIIFAHSNLFDSDNRMILSHLDKALKPHNQLKMMEDSLVIYRISRAPERRVFYIDVGNLPKTKAEEYMRDIMNSYQNRLVYDPSLGQVKDSGDYMTMLDDFWMPRREGRGTQIETLAGGQNLGDIEDVTFFKQNLYESLQVPQSRLQPDQGFQLGRATEITRDELNFKKLINKLRQEFAEVFSQALRVELLLTGILTEEEWEEHSYDFEYEFNSDSYFSELKQMEILQDRINLYESFQRSELVGKYYSHDYVRQEILKQTEEEIRDQDKLISKEKTDKRYNNDEDEDDMDEFGFGGQPQMPGQQPPIEKPEPQENPMRTGEDNPMRDDPEEKDRKNSQDDEE